MKAVLVLPTYKESDNVQTMLRALLSLEPELRVLVVDDNSPEGTGDIVDALSRCQHRISLLRWPGKLGLGSAYRDGFRHAVKQMGADLILQMDCDHTHDPREIPKCLEAVKSADLVIGSRYVMGGRTEGWPWSRKLMSRTLNLAGAILARFWVRDCSSGFRCYRRAALERIRFDETESVGYAFQIEMALRCIACGLRVAEIPITFRERRHGNSKISRAIMLEAAWLLLKMGKVIAVSGKGGISFEEAPR